MLSLSYVALHVAVKFPGFKNSGKRIILRLPGNPGTITHFVQKFNSVVRLLHLAMHSGNIFVLDYVLKLNIIYALNLLG